MPSLYIIRGAPGSGKTTLGMRLKSGGLVRYVIASDDYMNGPTGEYLFQPTRLKECHERCKIDAVSMLKAGASVAVCNTFTRIWEMQPYVDMARNLDCDLYVLKCEGSFQNIHGVPESKVREMRDRFEEWTG